MGLPDISLFDLFVLTIIGITIALGLWKGLVVQVFGLGGLIAGYILSTRYYLKIAGLLPDINQGTARIIGFLSIFILCIIVSFLLGRLATRVLKLAGLSWANRLLGGAAGLLKGVLITMVVLIIMLAFLPSGNAMFRDSLTVPHIITASKLFMAAVPEDIKVKYKKRIELLELLRSENE
ncbi:MAG: CvpA family protein [Nitrospirae bacterium]|nr:MAG: CvpA family protein [Nitrospirota bacterium]